MPTIGQIVRGKDIGRQDRCKFIWCTCKSCGKGRWVRLNRYNKGEQTHCQRCKPRKGGTGVYRRGYVLVRLLSTDFYAPMMTKEGYVYEHRLVMSKHLGRLLLKQEVIHHKNGIKDDNRIGNLQLLSNASSHVDMKICSHCELRKEIRLLRWQLKELLGEHRLV